MSIRQKLSVLLAVIYITGMAGLAFNLHYCGGKLAEVALYKAAKPCKMCSASAEKEEKHGCCETSVVDVKVKDDHQAQAKTLNAKPLVSFLLPEWSVSVPLVHESALAGIRERTSVQQTGPPVSATILNCVFRI